MRQPRRFLVCLVALCTFAACAAPPSSTPTSQPINPTLPPISTPAAEATDSKPTPRLFGRDHLYGGAPAITASDSESWDGQYIAPGASIFHDGTFYFVALGVHDGITDHGVGYYTSTDGFHWERATDAPLWDDLQLGLAEPGPVPSSLLIEPDGTWVLYLWGTVEATNETAIWRATAPGINGPWTAQPESVLQSGPSGEWDGEGVLYPSVVKTADGYLMIYDGYNSQLRRGSDSLGLATSADGITWQKHDEPATASAPFAASDPVYKPRHCGGFDNQSVQRPRVVATPTGLVMIYSALAASRLPMTRGLAFSIDGQTWTCYSANPILTDDDFDAGFIHEHDLIFYENTYFLLQEVITGDRQHQRSEIWLAVFEGDLNP